MENFKANVLIVEGDINLSGVIADYLREKGFTVVSTISGSLAIEKLNNQPFDLCLLSSTEDMSDAELIREIRLRGCQIPLILLSERSAREDIIAAYHMGADDYVIKPLQMDVLVCKMKAILRVANCKEVCQEEVFELGNIHFDATRQLLGDKRLSTRENELLLLLSRNINKVVDRSLILKNIWKNDDCFTARSLSVYIHHLRHYLQAAQGICLISVHGKGYKLVEE